MTVSDARQKPPSVETLQLWLAKVPYAQFLGIRAELRDEEILFILPENEKLIGNPSLPALHGGVIGAFMEQAAAFYLIARTDNPVLPKIINFSLDYLRAARLRETYAQCRLTRQGRFIANITITAWQEDYDQPNAIARTHFLIPDE